jgi:hypothetical protein
MSFGTNKYANRKPSQPTEYKRPQPQQENKGQGSSVGGKDFGPTPDVPALNLKVKNDKQNVENPADNYDYVGTVYPRFSKEGDIYYHSTKNSDANLFVDNALVIKSKAADGTVTVVGIITPRTTDKGYKIYTPITDINPTQLAPFFASEKKPS